MDNLTHEFQVASNEIVINYNTQYAEQLHSFHVNRIQAIKIKYLGQTSYGEDSQNMYESVAYILNMLCKK